MLIDDFYKLIIYISDQQTVLAHSYNDMSQTTVGM